jgi:hypothetical protein
MFLMPSAGTHSATALLKHRLKIKETRLIHTISGGICIFKPADLPTCACVSKCSFRKVSDGFFRSQSLPEHLRASATILKRRLGPVAVMSGVVQLTRRSSAEHCRRCHLFFICFKVVVNRNSDRGVFSLGFGMPKIALLQSSQESQR